MLSHLTEKNQSELQKAAMGSRIPPIIALASSGRNPLTLAYPSCIISQSQVTGKGSGSMKIIAVDPFYLKMSQITDAADGTQDTLLVRIQTDEGITGWGECDASPLVSLAVYCCPMSHGNIINIRESLIGETLDDPNDVVRLHQKDIA